MKFVLLVVALAFLACVYALPVADLSHDADPENSNDAMNSELVITKAQEIAHALLVNDVTRQNIIQMFKDAKSNPDPDKLMEANAKLKLKDMIKRASDIAKHKMQVKREAHEIAHKILSDENIHSKLVEMFKDDDPVKDEENKMKLKDMLRTAMLTAHSKDTKVKEAPLKDTPEKEKDSPLEDAVEEDKETSLQEAVEQNKKDEKEEDSSLADAVEKDKETSLKEAVEQNKKDEKEEMNQQVSEDEARNMATKILSNDAAKKKIVEMLADAKDDPKKLAEKKNQLKDMIRAALLKAEEKEALKSDDEKVVEYQKNEVANPKEDEHVIEEMEDSAAKEEVEQKDVLEEKQEADTSAAEIHAMAKSILSDDATRKRIQEMFKDAVGDPVKMEEKKLQLKDMIMRARDAAESNINEKKEVDDVMKRKAHALSMQIVADKTMREKLTTMLKDVTDSSARKEKLKDLVKDYVNYKTDEVFDAKKVIETDSKDENAKAVLEPNDEEKTNEIPNALETKRDSVIVEKMEDEKKIDIQPKKDQAALEMVKEALSMKKDTSAQDDEKKGSPKEVTEKDVTQSKEEDTEISQDAVKEKNPKEESKLDTQEAKQEQSGLLLNSGKEDQLKNDDIQAELKSIAKEAAKLEDANKQEAISTLESKADEEKSEMDVKAAIEDAMEDALVEEKEIEVDDTFDDFSELMNSHMAN